MNERIKYLIVEAGFPKFDKMYVVSDGAELEKFALLIVQECAKRSAELGQPEIGLGLMKHFGVEA